MPLNTAFLRKLSYRDSRGEITAEFQKDDSLLERSFDFTPEMRLPFNRAVSALAKGIVSPIEGLIFSEGGSRCVIHGKSFSLLKKAHALLSLSLNASIPLPEPERQFLLARSWKYFDEFNLEKGRVEKTGERNFTGLPEGIPLRRALLSRVLSLSVESLPSLQREIGSILIENAAFRASQLVSGEKRLVGKKNYCSHVFNDFVELDFSRAVLEKIAECNLGFETLNCSCCVPESLNAANVLSNSMVEVEFSGNGYYFDSMLSSFSQQYHKSHGNKKARIERKQEFYLEHYPIGPFFSGDRAMVLLLDARRLEAGHSAVITSCREELKWCCMKQQSFLAKEIERILSLEKAARERIMLIERSELRKNGLNAFNPCFESAEKQALKEKASLCSELSNALFSSIAKHSILFQAIEAFKTEIVSSYNDKLEQRHSGQIYSNAGRAFIRSREVFTDLALVSREAGIPLPSLY